jgi:protein TonB
MSRAQAASFAVAAALHAALLLAAPASWWARPRLPAPEVIRLELALAAPAPAETSAQPSQAALPRGGRSSASARTERAPRVASGGAPVPAPQRPTRSSDPAHVQGDPAPVAAGSPAAATTGGPAPPGPGVEGLESRYHAVSHPSYLERVEPTYPAQARRLRQEGVVVLRLFIGAGGGLDRIEVAKSSGHRLLDEAAIAAEGRSRFRPATVGGRPVPCTAEVPYRFELE